MAKRWAKWERELRTRLVSPDLLQNIYEHSQLNGFQDSKGRITYNKIANKKSFGVFSEMVNLSFPREGIYNIPSISRTLKRDAFVYPFYFVQFTSLEDEDFDLTRSETPERPDIGVLLDYYDEHSRGRPMIGICILENIHMEMFHGIAFILWQSKTNGSSKQYSFAYYDPIAYQRKNVRSDGRISYANYDYAKKTFQSRNFPDENIQFINLSDMCLKKNEEEYHCPQYVMNAEYCFLNSLYFLYKWVEFAKPTSTSGLQNVVNACYIVEHPSKLTRSQTRESMTYRVIMMSFIITAFYRYFTMLKTRVHKVPRIEEHLQQLLEFTKIWQKEFGFHLLHPMFIRNLSLSTSSSVFT